MPPRRQATASVSASTPGTGTASVSAATPDGTSGLEDFVAQAKANAKTKSRTKVEDRKQRAQPTERNGEFAFTMGATLSTNRAQRVLAYTVGGGQVGLAGFTKEGLGFPAPYGVGAALASPHWVRPATAEEIAEGHDLIRSGDKCFKPLEWQPRSMIHSNGALAFANEEIGLFGSHVTVLHGAPKLQQHEDGHIPCDAAPESPPSTPSTSSTPPMRD